MNFLWIFCFALVVSCALSVETQPSSDRQQRAPSRYQPNSRSRKSISLSFSHGRGFGWQPGYGGAGYGYGAPIVGWGR